MIDHDKAIQIQQKLLNWYTDHHRDLPWRKDKNPYRIWVSEIMLQQTRVETVIPYFERFMRQFPSLHALAEAKEEEVLKAWEGLGYYSRARNLHTAVKEVVLSYGGEVPNDPAKISALKGVGPYTTGAILSIAFNRKWPAVDGNVLRVFARLFALTDNIALPQTRKKFEKIAEAVIPDESPGDFNQALMELGATICKPSSPSCLLCPVRECCEGFSQGKQEDLPIKSKAKAPTEVPVVCLWISEGTKVLLEKRELGGLLAGMWALPTIEQVTSNMMQQKISEYLADRMIHVTDYTIIGAYDHVFTHRHWKITLVSVKVTSAILKESADLNWLPIGQLSNIALANVYRKALPFT